VSAAEVYVIRGVTDGEPWALDLFEQYMDRRLGPDPLAEGGCSWPAWTSSETRTRTTAHPLKGWRMFGVADTDQGLRLCAPFLTAIHGETLDLPGVEWLPGTNTNSTRHCAMSATCYHDPRCTHPLIECACGIRVMRSIHVLRTFHNFARSQEPDTGPMIAYAQVAAWGRLAPAARDDFRHTIRAQYVAIAGPLHVALGWDHRTADIEALAEHYDIEVKRDPLARYGGALAHRATRQRHAHTIRQMEPAS
jgi:hypothetical protein